MHFSKQQVLFFQTIVEKETAAAHHVQLPLDFPQCFIIMSEIYLYSHEMDFTFLGLHELQTMNSSVLSFKWKHTLPFSSQTKYR